MKLETLFIFCLCFFFLFCEYSNYQATTVQTMFQRAVFSRNNSQTVIFIRFRGTFLMEREDGINIDCRIPPFSLDSTSANLDTNEYTE